MQTTNMEFKPPPYVIIDFYDWLTEPQLAHFLVKDLNFFLNYLDISIKSSERKPHRIMALSRVLKQSVSQWKQFQLMFKSGVVIPLHAHPKWKAFYYKLSSVILKISKISKVSTGPFITSTPPRGLGNILIAQYVIPEPLPFPELLDTSDNFSLLSQDEQYICMKMDAETKVHPDKISILKSKEIPFEKSEDPFYESQLHDPLCILIVENHPFNVGHIDEFSAPEKLEEDQVVIVRVFPDYEINMCYAHKWPLNSTIFINGVHVNTSNVISNNKNVSIKDSYANITSLCKLGAINNIVFYGYFSINKYFLLVQIMKKIQVEELLFIIKNNNTISKSKCLESIKKYFTEDEECQELAKKVVLLDPIMCCKIKEPGKSEFCEHLECFDLRNYLMLNEQIRSWMCPICSKYAPYDSLVFDQYFEEIINSTSPEKLDVEIAPDGSLNNNIIASIKQERDELLVISSDSEDDSKSQTRGDSDDKKAVATQSNTNSLVYHQNQLHSPEIAQSTQNDQVGLIDNVEESPTNTDPRFNMVQTHNQYFPYNLITNYYKHSNRNTTHPQALPGIRCAVPYNYDRLTGIPYHNKNLFSNCNGKKNVIRKMNSFRGDAHLHSKQIGNSGGYFPSSPTNAGGLSLETAITLDSDTE